MTIQNETVRINYIGDGVQTVFAMTNILVFDEAHVRVYFDNVIQPTGWTFVGIGNPSGGTVTFGTAPAVGVVVTLLREVPQNQLADYVAYDSFPAETHERQLDLAAMGRQQLQDLGVRWEPSTPPGSALPTPIPLAVLSTDASAVMFWGPPGGAEGIFVQVGPENETSQPLSASVVQALPGSPDPHTLYFVTGSAVP